MPSPHQKTRSLRRIYIKTPGGTNKIHYRIEKPKITKCANCKEPLKGIPRLLPSKQRNTPKSQKTVARAFGGNLCSHCTREHIKAMARKQ